MYYFFVLLHFSSAAYLLPRPCDAIAHPISSLQEFRFPASNRFLFHFLTGAAVCGNHLDGILKPFKPVSADVEEGMKSYPANAKKCLELSSKITK